MTFEAYTNPDFTVQQKLLFFVVALAGILICNILIIAGVKISTLHKEKEEQPQLLYEGVHNRIQRFYEMMISGCSVLSFSCAYVILNHINTLYMSGAKGGPTLDWIMDVWQNGRDFVLLLLICLSCVINSLLDKIFIPLKRISREEKACIRMLAMFYVIIILAGLNSVGDESEYNPVMIYYLGLMIGRFVYFDASFIDFIHALVDMFKNIYLLIMGLLLTGLLTHFGFEAGYLLERNYYIVGIFYTHLFLLVVIFLLNNTGILKLIFREPATEEDAEKDNEEDYEEYEEEDDAEEEYVIEDYDDDEEYEEETVVLAAPRHTVKKRQ